MEKKIYNDKVSKSNITFKNTQVVRNKDNEIKKTFIEWCLVSSTHGISQFVRNDNITIKFMWLIFFLASSGLCITLLIQSMNEFFSFKVNTNIEVINDIDAYFPAITICNLNPYNERVGQELNQVLKDKYNYSFFSHVPPVLYKSANKALKLYISTKNDYEKQYNYGYTLMDIQLDCLFATNSCPRRPETRMKWFYDIEYGSCFRFNGNKSNILRSGKYGQKGGLYLELYVGNSSLNEAFTNKRGYRVLIHNTTDEFVDIEGRGFDLEPGTVNSISIKRTYYERLPYPYSDCIDDLTINYQHKTKIMESMFNELNITYYSQHFCEKYRYNEFLYGECNCVDLGFTVPNKFQNFCVLQEQTICAEKAFYKYYTDLKSFVTPDNNCPKECSKMEFNIQLSQSQHYSNWYFNIVKEFYSDRNRKYGGTRINVTVEHLKDIAQARNDILAAYFYYDDISYTHVIETPLWNINTLLSNFGGQIGLN